MEFAGPAPLSCSQSLTFSLPPVYPPYQGGETLYNKGGYDVTFPPLIFRVYSDVIFLAVIFRVYSATSLFRYLFSVFIL